MNRKEWKERLPLIQAFVEGKAVEVKGWHTDYEWVDAPNPSFSQDVEYRIKPEPKVIWVNEYGDGSGDVFDDKEEAQAFNGPAVRRLAVKYVEVIE